MEIGSEFYGVITYDSIDKVKTIFFIVGYMFCSFDVGLAREILMERVGSRDDAVLLSLLVPERCILQGCLHDGVPKAVVVCNGWGIDEDNAGYLSL